MLLAAVIINPRRFSVLHPSRRIERRVQLIAGRMRRRGYLTADQYAVAIGRAPAPAPSQSFFSRWFFGLGGGHDTRTAPPAAAPESSHAPDSGTVPTDSGAGQPAP